MKLQQFLDVLNGAVKNDPSLLELDVVYASDEEGNSYHLLGNEPNTGRFEDNDFMFSDELEIDDEPNAICIN